MLSESLLNIFISAKANPTYQEDKGAHISASFWRSENTWFYVWNSEEFPHCQLFDKDENLSNQMAS